MVRLSRTARKQLAKVPDHIVRKFAIWVDLVKADGLVAARAIPGFRDHALQGEWEGFRAIRLNEAYRAIYRMVANGMLEMVHVEEVIKHDC